MAVLGARRWRDACDKLGAVLDWGRELTRDAASADSREWLCTNGIGGFASGTVSGILTRRYHGLLVAALDPPLGRALLVSRAEERIVDGTQSYELSANRWNDGVLAPHGFELIERFRLDGTVPVWTYACADLRIEKRIVMEHGANTTYVVYRLVRGERPVTLELRVLVNHRDFHAVTRGGDWWMAVAPVPDGIRVQAHDAARPFFVLARGAEVEPAHDWYLGFRLVREEERGLEYLDDHLHAATFRTTLAPGADVTLVASTEEHAALDGGAALRRHAARERTLLTEWRRHDPAARQAPPYVRHLVLAADAFVVSGRRRASIIAGYPWFTDWGRDTMVALPGLLLATGRTRLARDVLLTYADQVDGGMLANRFSDEGDPPAYNSVDAALWYVEAVRAYDATAKDDATLARLFPVVASIVAAYRDGTRSDIGVDPADHLLQAGGPDTPLTWMDAVVDGQAVTPRAGKAVEINALWYNAVRAVATLSTRLGRPAAEWDGLADAVRAGFARFWNAAEGCCFDVLDTPEGDDDASVRPNQILAVAVHASPLTTEQQRSVVEVCARWLVTSYGVRTLHPEHPAYQGRATGNVAARDRAYHQGTAWTWLLGAFARAHHRAHGDRAAALDILAPLAQHLEDAGVGSISEIFDGDAPHAPGGCPFQAWSVGEVLRAYATLAR